MVHAPFDLFNIQHYSDVRQPLDLASPLPHWCYTSQTFFGREYETIFARQWLFLCKADRLTDTGAFITDTLFGIPVVAVRGEDGLVRAFVNSCRHRSCEVVSGNGRGQHLICPYHHWRYDLYGQLVQAPGLSKKQLAHDPNRLKALACEDVEGLIFVNLDVQAPSFSEMAPGYRELYRQYSITALQPVASRTWKLASNWKTYVEVDMETLHTPHIHSSSIGVQKTELAPTDGDWICLYHREPQTIALKPGEARHAFDPIPSLKADGLAGTYFSIVYPGFFLVTTRDCIWWINKIPLSAEQTRVDATICFHPNAIARDDFEERVKHYLSRWEQVVVEDNWITEVQQRGIQGGVKGRYTRMERAVHQLDNWILDRALGSQAQAAFNTTSWGARHEF